MIFYLPCAVESPDRVLKNTEIRLGGFSNTTIREIRNSIAYPPLINSHDHLVGNWYPRAGNNRPYVNSHIWVEDMKEANSYRERDKVWLNDGSFNLTEGNAKILVNLGVYKNLFSGVGLVQDHAPRQIPLYYKNRPIEVLEEYWQCHSLTLGNWWGGKKAEEEMEATGGTRPFIIHVGEGLDERTRGEFALLMERGLLRRNTLMIHAVSFTKEEIARVGEAGASICWCPGSNEYLLDRTADIEECLQRGVNVVLGTDSTMSGTVNLFSEIRKAHELKPLIPAKELYRMVTVNAAYALLKPLKYGRLNDLSGNLLVMDQLDEDPFENILLSNTENIRVFVVNNHILYGDIEYLEACKLDEAQYSIFKIGNREKFVFGNPAKILDEIESYLGYRKTFPYMPVE